MVSTEPVENYFNYTLKKGINHLELDLKKGHSLLSSFTNQRIENIRDYCRSNNITLSMHPPFNMNLCSIIPVVRRTHTKYIKNCLELAQKLGARHLTLHLGNFYRFAPWANPRQSALSRLLKVLSNLLPTCRETGVSLALENMVPIPAEAGYAFLGDNIADFQYIFSRIQDKHIQFCLDTGHANNNEGPAAYVESLFEHLLSIHYHDNNGDIDEHLDVGMGTVPWSELLNLLDRKGYTGPYISECFKSPPHEAKERLESYFQEHPDVLQAPLK